MPTKRLTVVQTLPALDSGGVERGTLEVGRALVAAGHRSIVISAGGRLVPQLEREGSEHVTWDIGRKSLWTLRLVPRLRRFLLDNHVDILHLRSRLPAWVGYLAWRGMDPAARPRLVTTVHGLYSVNRYSAIMTRGERVIAVSETVREYILTHYPACDPARIVVIPRGIDRAEYPYNFRPDADWLTAWQRQYPHLAGQRLITLPGRITRLKGHEDFIRLISRLRARGLDVHGLIVGGAEAKKRAYLEALQTQVARAGLEEAITFTGQRADLREILAISDLVLSLSTQPESFGRTVLEALSLGVPVAGYDHGGVGEQLRHLLPEGRVSVGDLDAMTALCARWLETPPTVPREHPFTLQAMLEDTLHLYENLARPVPDKLSIPFERGSS